MRADPSVMPRPRSPEEQLGLILIWKSQAREVDSLDAWAAYRPWVACIYRSSRIPVASIAPAIRPSQQRRRLLVEPESPAAARHSHGAASRKCLSRLPTSPTFSRTSASGLWLDHGVRQADDRDQRLQAQPCARRQGRAADVPAWPRWARGLAGDPRHVGATVRCDRARSSGFWRLRGAGLDR